MTEEKEGELIIRFPIHKKDDFTRMLNGEKFQFALQNLDNELRDIEKYSESETERAFAERVRELINRHLGEWGVSIWE